ncbi:MAG: tetratricopeptide repeat protein [Leptolyngbyaceae cyanobacterium]
MVGINLSQEYIDLENAVTQYETALTVVLTKVDKPSPIPSQAILDMLMARDVVETLRKQQANHRSSQHTAIFLRLVELDQELRKQAGTLAKKADFASYQQSIKPDQNSWWWFLESTPEKSKLHKHDRFDWIWNGITVVFLVGATSFATTTAKAFSTQGFDLIGLASSFTQGAGLALLAGGTFTDRGRKVFKSALDSVSIPSHYHAEVTCLFSATLFLTSGVIHHRLTWFGEQYYLAGKEHRQKGNNLRAFESFQRALNFQPEHIYAYSGLGNVSERMGQLDEAATYYEQGIALSRVSSSFSALGLGRITLLRELTDNGWTSQLSSSKIREIDFLLELASYFNTTSDGPGLGTYSRYMDVVIEKHTHLGLLELTKLDLKSLPYGQHLDPDDSVIKEDTISIEAGLKVALDYFEKAQSVELLMIIFISHTYDYHNDTDMINLLKKLNQRLEVENLDTEAVSERVRSISELSQLDEQSLKELKSLLMNTSSMLESRDSIEIFEDFIDEHLSSTEASIMENRQSIDDFRNDLSVELTFDVGKPRCYFEITKFIEFSAFERLAESLDENLLQLAQILNEQKQAVNSACGIAPETRFATVDLRTLSIYDRILMDKLLMLPKEFLPEPVYPD